LARIAIAKNEDAQVDRFYSILYNEKPLLCERLEWLEKGRQEEDAKDGVIRLPVDGKNEKL
jgi:putative alpha-1,2-mannosidase